TKHCPKNQEHAEFLSKNGHVFFCKDCFAINEQDTKLTREAFEKAKAMASSGKYDLVVLDEVFWAIKERLLSQSEVLSLLKERHPSCEMILTGRGAGKEIEEISDYVTYVQKVKHPFDKGLISRSGIDY
ncbi:MAG: cob(I)yrinic acid a,c-diamide adenosyltransferase, partial [Candidatus Anstonellaceae archaeon]